MKIFFVLFPIAADEAVFGLSEINWGIIPAGVVCKAISTVMSERDALYYIMTGETFDAGVRSRRAKRIAGNTSLLRLVSCVSQTLRDWF